MSFTIGFSGAKCIARSVGFGCATPVMSFLNLEPTTKVLLVYPTLSHSHHSCPLTALSVKMALLIVWNNIGTDTFFRHSTNYRFKRLSMCISEGCRFQRTPEGRRGVTQSRPSSRTSSLKRKGNCHNLRNMLCQAFCTTIHCNIMTPFVGCWNKLGECFEIFYLSANILPLISAPFLLLQLHRRF